MITDNYIKLIYKELKGEISPNELKSLRTWEKASAANQAEADAIRETWESAHASEDLPFDLDMDADFANIQAQISAIPKEEAKQVRMPTPRNNWMRIAAAGAILIIAGFVIRNFLSSSATTWKTISATDKIEEIQLADGTQVWLNMGSQLSFPEEFTDNARQVELKGEAYFEVTKNPKKRFEVLTEKTSVTVLGTKFNVRERNDEGLTQVSVSEGKVQVQERDKQQKVILAKNETARYSHQTGELREQADMGLNALAWQRKSLIFRDDYLIDALAEIEKQYQIKILLQRPDLGKCQFSGRYKVKTKLLDLLQDVATFTGADVKKEGENTYVIVGGKCP